MNPNAKATTRNVNKALKAAGREEQIVQGRGYAYFTDGESHTWDTSSIPVCKIGHMTLARAIVFFNEMAGTSIKVG